jgi:hypothetical protein
MLTRKRLLEMLEYDRTNVAKQRWVASLQLRKQRYLSSHDTQAAAIAARQNFERIM